MPDGPAPGRPVPDAARERSERTRERLVDACVATLRERGIAGVSARTIAGAAGVNQALVFYHFGTVDTLVGDACRIATRRRIAAFADRLDAVTGFAGLVALARDVDAEEQHTGNVRVLAQALAGAQTNPALAAATGEALGLWTDEIERVLRRVLPGSALGEVMDARALAELVSAAFVGVELVGVTRPAALDALTRFGELAAVLDATGPVLRRAVRSALRRGSGAGPGVG